MSRVVQLCKSPLTPTRLSSPKSALSPEYRGEVEAMHRHDRKLRSFQNGPCYDDRQRAAFYEITHYVHRVQSRRVKRSRIAIGRVTFSQTGKTLHYGGRKFQSLKGMGFKANYFDIETGEEYWISGCKKDGTDRLYGGSTAIDADVQR